MWCSTAPFPTISSYFQSLDHIVQTEPWLERDKAMIDQLRSRLGIEKGKPFSPDSKTKEILERTALGGEGRRLASDARLERLPFRLRTF